MLNHSYALSGYERKRAREVVLEKWHEEAERAGI